MPKTRVAIIGTGNIAHAHLAGLLALKDRCQVTALCDIYPEKCPRLLDDLKVDEEYRKDIIITPDYSTLLDRDDIDLACICLPPSVHAPATCDFLLHGKNVLCEKPMASSLKEADEMIQARDKSGKMLAIISQNRFYRDAMTVKKMLDEGVFGRVLTVRANSMWYRGGCYYDLWWRGTWENEGGGCILNHAVHQIDMLSWFLGRELPETMTAVFTNLSHTNSEVEDTGMALLTYPDKVAQINVSLCDMDERQYFQFICEKASVSVPFSVKCMVSQPNGFPLPDPESEKRFTEIYNQYKDLEYKGHTGEINDVLDYLEGKKDSIVVTAEDGRNALELIYGFYKAAATKSTITLPIGKDDPVYTKEGMIQSMPRFFRKTKSIENAEGTITLGSAAKEDR